MRRLLVLLMLLAISSAPAWSQSGTATNIRNGGTLPALCTVGQVFFLTTASPTIGMWECTSTNTWSLPGSGVGVPRLDQILNPTANKTFAMGTNSLALNYHGSSATTDGAFLQAHFLNGETTIAPFMYVGPPKSTLNGSDSANFSRAATVFAVANPTLANANNSVFIYLEDNTGNGDSALSVFQDNLGSNSSLYTSQNYFTNSVGAALTGSGGNFNASGALMASVTNRGTAANLQTLYLARTTNTGTLTTNEGLFIDDQSGVATNNYAIHIDDQATAGATNWAIKTGLGLVELGDALEVHGNIGFFATTPTTKKTVSGSKGGNAALASLLTALAAYGLVTDSTS